MRNAMERQSATQDNSIPKRKAPVLGPCTHARISSFSNNISSPNEQTAPEKSLMHSMPGSMKSSRVPSNKLSLTYDRKILVEEVDNVKHDLGETEPSLIKFPKPSSMNVTHTVKRRQTSNNVNNVRALLTLGAIDPTINQFRNKPVFD